MSTSELIAVGGGTSPLDDAEALAEKQGRKNFAKVGSARPSSLLYTYGPGAIIDLPHFTIMPSGMDDWERIWARRQGPVPEIHAPRLLESVQLQLGPQVSGLRPFPHQPTENAFSREGSDLGVPARIFPQWLRCTGCDLLAPLEFFTRSTDGYVNTHPYRPDEAVVQHVGCPGRVAKTGGGARGKAGGTRRNRTSPCVPARYLLACPDGHLDEFPYDWWVHQGGKCSKAPAPVLEMTDTGASRGASATVTCRSCGVRRPMNQAQGEVGRTHLPKCRGRLPHVDAFVKGGCEQETRLMLVGASNLWFPVTQSIIDMPRLDPAAQLKDDANQLRAALGEDLSAVSGNLKMLRIALKQNPSTGRLVELDDAALGDVVAAALGPQESEAEREERRRRWSPTDLLVPEWRYLEQDPPEERHADKRSGLTVSPRALPVGESGPVPGVGRVLAVDRLRKVNALLGFTRIDDFDRIDDSGSRLVPLCRGGRPAWVPATEDRGEGVFLQLDEARVSAWEQRVEASGLWERYVAAHKRNFERRYSETAKEMDHLERMQPARYWLVHTLAHALMRQMSMHSGYGAASLSERLYAWKPEGERPAAAGMLITTTASDSDGTLGGLVALSAPARLGEILDAALRGLMRCSSDPVCARRVPEDPEDFLHGAACHCCTMASETSCERANRFLDRRLVVPLPGAWRELAFFEDPR
ncbi:DUF1998 domain-containing protein [Actinomyces procaprae]|uniref:DUF1998 domain-containing protein n=1 Tax=Actinomyces procaprae TaxID=2560010 RepID=UPI0010A2804E|nr:DUF1998 domain-containing protein [Actinomyces procaprae]